MSVSSARTVLDAVAIAAVASAAARQIVIERTFMILSAILRAHAARRIGELEQHDQAFGHFTGAALVAGRIRRLRREARGGPVLQRHAEARRHLAEELG